MTKRLLALLTTLVVALCTALPASADPTGGGDGKQYYIETQVRLHGSGYSPSGKVNLPPDFDPPKCWYEPRFTPGELEAFVKMIADLVGIIMPGLAKVWLEAWMKEIEPHKGESGKVFWALTHDKTPEGEACFQATNPFIKYVGPTPPIAANDQLIDPWDLARIARANLTLPDPVIRINPPGGRSYVGLETWVGTQRVRPVRVTAEVPGFPALSATITARPSRVTITTNGPGQVQDGKAQCPVYRKGASLGSGCWVRFSKSSLGSRYTITVTQHWTVTSNVGIALPPGEVSSSATLQVDEIQSTVRK
ncbi:hypothetical protein ACIBG8_23670 [Nonomuraea sp. NPDC050556]|uniref:hypothetical protein n=1 Tax=Nonomuraea sp. NPDC050556 TaxID=3364369 RepID=UPI0037A5E7B7